MDLIHPDKALQTIIRKANNEDIKTRDRDLKIIKTWLEQQPHLPNSWNETGLMNFLRATNFSLEKAKKKLDKYFTMRTAVPEIFTNRDITSPQLKAVLCLGSIVALPTLTPEGNRVTMFVMACETDSTDVVSMWKLVTMITDVRLATETYGVSGNVLIIDAKISLFENFLAVSPFLFRKLLICVQEAYPDKIKEVHIINPHTSFAMMYKVAKPFLKEKLKKRVYMHDKMETLYEFVPKEILPEEYGGGAERLCNMHENLLMKLKEFEDWFKEEENFKADESKRIGMRVNYENLYGVEGSFKKLDID